MSDSTLKEDILAALKKERDRLNQVKHLTADEEDRLSLCVEYIKNIRQSDETWPATLKVERLWSGPIRL